MFVTALVISRRHIECPNIYSNVRIAYITKPFCTVLYTNKYQTQTTQEQAVKTIVKTKWRNGQHPTTITHFQIACSSQRKEQSLYPIAITLFSNISHQSGPLNSLWACMPASNLIRIHVGHRSIHTLLLHTLK